MFCMPDWFLFFLGCTVNGYPGYGTSKGTCDDGQLCQRDGSCTAIQGQGGRFIVVHVWNGIIFIIAFAIIIRR